MVGNESEGAAFTVHDVLYGAALVRVSAHLDNAVECCRIGKAETALLHANRSLQLMPQISRELWRDAELATAINQAAARVPSAIRARKPLVEVAAARDSYDRHSARAVATVVGAAPTPAYRASVVVALLRTAAAAEAAGVLDDASAISTRARALVEALWGGAMLPESIEQAFQSLARDIEADPESFRGHVGAIATELHDSLGALLENEPSPREQLDLVARLVRDAAEAASAGDRFRADKLVATAYVEHYVPLREALATWHDEDKLNKLIGTELRRALASGEPIDALVEDSQILLTSAPA